MNHRHAWLLRRLSFYDAELPWLLTMHHVHFLRLVTGTKRSWRGQIICFIDPCLYLQGRT